MIKKVLKAVIIVLMIIGIILGISITIKRNSSGKSKKYSEINIYNMIQTKSAEATSFYTYGRSFNISGKISNISKDNFESAKLVITDGLDFQESYSLDVSFEDNDLIFVSDKEINAGIVIDKLEDSEYYILLRLKLNNSIDPKYYSFVNTSGTEDINYYTITSENTNKLAKIAFYESEYNNKEYNLLKITLEETELPEEVYDIVIDAGHGGKDEGEKSGNVTEADITLEYAKLLKESLEEKGYKVKLTRDDSNTGTYTYTNMYDENGRISIACKTKAKLMISFHVNSGASNLNGFEIYCPCNCNLDFAEEMASKIKEYSNISYSNNTSFKVSDGVYVHNFTSSVIKEYAQTANKKGYEPYNITTSTPYLYTIREVGGIATGAYVDGRNTQYSKNEYYNSNQGIECYQLELGYIKTDLQTITSEKENYIRAITESICNNFK
jgi:N-acetylmuramoyl-L-alanine amidase